MGSSEFRLLLFCSFAACLIGVILPPCTAHLQGLNPYRCLSAVSFPRDWHFTHSDSHWLNETTIIAHIERILLPYVTKKREKLKLPSDCPA